MFDERTPVEPRGAYSNSKKYAEEALERLSDGRFAPTILRQGTVYGYSPRMRFDLVVNTFLKDAVTVRKLYLHGGGWQWRPLVAVSDVAAAHILCLTAKPDPVRGEIFNVMQENYQVRQLAMLVAGSLSLVGRSVELVDAPLPKIVRDYRMTNLKMTQRLGLHARRNGARVDRRHAQAHPARQRRAARRSAALQHCVDVRARRSARLAARLREHLLRCAGSSRQRSRRIFVRVEER